MGAIMQAWSRGVGMVPAGLGQGPGHPPVAVGAAFDGPAEPCPPPGGSVSRVVGSGHESVHGAPEPPPRSRPWAQEQLWQGCPALRLEPVPVGTRTPTW